MGRIVFVFVCLQYVFRLFNHIYELLCMSIAIYVCIVAVQYPNRGEDQYRPSLLSSPLIHVYIPLYVYMSS